MREKYVDQLYDQSKIRDKYVLTLSSSALAVTVGFVEKIVPLNTAIFISVLYFSWLSFALSIILMVLSHHFSERCYSDYIKQLDDAAISNTESSELFSKHRRTVDIFTNSSLVLFCIGVLLFVMFSITNVNSIRSELSQVATSPASITKQGSVVSPIPALDDASQVRTVNHEEDEMSENKHRLEEGAKPIQPAPQKRQSPPTGIRQDGAKPVPPSPTTKPK